MMRKHLMMAVSIVFLMGATMTSCSSDEEPKIILETQTKEEDNPKETEKEDGEETPKSPEIVVDMLPTTRNIELTQQQRAFAQKNNDFSFNFYRALSATTEHKSLITSPLSLTFVLGMLNDGAAGKTAEEIIQTLGFGEADKQAVNEYCKALITQAPVADPSVALKIANIVAANKDVELEDAFKADMSGYYEAETASLDFSQPSALTYLNDWCNAKTEGMIEKILDELSPETKLVLMNAIYFKATWTEKFDEKDTNKEPFTKADGSTAEQPMMHRKAEIMYAANDLYSCIRLPFGSGDRYSMYVLLPEAGKTVDDVIAGLTKESWERNPFEPVNADIKLPRFATNSDLKLNDIIAGLGTPSMFDPDKADFSGISKNMKQLYVNLLKQKAAIEVSEEGTKTSAVTVAGMNATSLGPEKSVEFHANRPFVYLIQEWSTNAIFFIGTFYGENN